MSLVSSSLTTPLPPYDSMARSNTEEKSAAPGTATPMPEDREERSGTQEAYLDAMDLDDLLKVDLSNLDKQLLKRTHFRLVTLKRHNYHIWAQSHKRFLRGRGIWGIVSGSLPLPTSRKEAENWMILDG